MPNALFEAVKSHVADRGVSGLVIEVEHVPLNGPASPVAPPTYASEGPSTGSPRHAVTDDAFVPAPAADGWYTELQRDPVHGTPRLARRVVLDSFAAQSGRAETALWQQRERLGLRLPALVVGGQAAAEDVDDPDLAGVLGRSFSTWELAHRQNDAWVKFATADGERLVWQQEVVEVGDDAGPQEVKALISAASSERGDLLYRYFPNAAVYGYWISSGVATRHRQPRAYSSEIVGFGAEGVASGATKLDPTGGALKSTGVAVNADRSLSVKATGSRGTRPSLLGFGQIPAAPETRAYLCELILEQSSISLQVLRGLHYREQAQEPAATAVLVLLALAGHALASEDGFLRSGCALVPVGERWGWRRRGVRSPEPLEVASIDDIASALRLAIEDAERIGLSFAEPIPLRFSQPEVEIIRQRVVSDAEKLKTEEE